MIEVSPYQGSQTINVPGGTIQWVAPAEVAGDVPGEPAPAQPKPRNIPGGRARMVAGLIQEVRRFAWRKGTALHSGPRVGRNDPCACGSGRKSKRCCRGGA